MELPSNNSDAHILHLKSDLQVFRCAFTCIILFGPCSNPVKIIDIVIPYKEGTNCVLESQLYCVLIHIVTFGAGTPKLVFLFLYSWSSNLINLHWYCSFWFYRMGIVWRIYLGLTSISCTVLSLSFVCLFIMNKMEKINKMRRIPILMLIANHVWVAIFCKHKTSHLLMPEKRNKYWCSGKLKQYTSQEFLIKFDHLGLNAPLLSSVTLPKLLKTHFSYL